MFPSFLTHLRAALIRSADLMLRLVTLEALAFPDTWFASPPSTTAIRAQRTTRRPGPPSPPAEPCAWNWPADHADHGPGSQRGSLLGAPRRAGSAHMRAPRRGALPPATACTNPASGTRVSAIRDPSAIRRRP